MSGINALALLALTGASHHTSPPVLIITRAGNRAFESVREGAERPEAAGDESATEDQSVDFLIAHSGLVQQSDAAPFVPAVSCRRSDCNATIVVPQTDFQLEKRKNVAEGIFGRARTVRKMGFRHEPVPSWSPHHALWEGYKPKTLGIGVKGLDYWLDDQTSIGLRVTHLSAGIGTLDASKYPHQDRRFYFSLGKKWEL